MKFYLDLDGYGEPAIWHDPGEFGGFDAPIPVITKHQVPDGYWDELVRRLTGEAS